MNQRRYRGPGHRSKSPRRCRCCGHDVDWHEPRCARCRHGRRCSRFRAPYALPAAVVICHRTPTHRPSEITRWRDAAEAIAAERELCDPCGPYCEGVHTVATYGADGTVHVRRGSHDPRTPDLAALYPTRHRPSRNPRLDPPPVESWPAPAEFNPPLTRPRTPGITAEQLQRGQTVALRRQLTPAPSPSATLRHQNGVAGMAGNPPTRHGVTRPKKERTMPGLFEAARRAREIADASTDPSDGLLGGARNAGRLTARAHAR
jgi:hypothetical protein